MANSINTHKVRYDDYCMNNTINCSVPVIPKATLKSPKFYYKIENFYGNHRNFIKSRSYAQLRGSSDYSIGDCDPIKKNRDINTVLPNINGATLDGNADANPCGLIAKNYFNDNFWLYDSSGNNITIDDSSIAHSVDRNSRFERPSNYEDVQWLDTEDEHLMVWYQTDAFSDFIKLFGSIDTDLQKGMSYSVLVNNTWGDPSYDTKKYIFISETNSFGGDNITFGVLYITAG